MKLSVPSRFETGVLEAIRVLNRKYGSVVKIYGSLPSSIIGHGRVSGAVMRYGDFDMERVKEFAEQAHLSGVETNYLANSLCLGELGYENGGREKIVRYLRDVYEAGVDILTVSSPYLLRIAKSEFPNLKVEISVHAHVDTVQKFRRWEELGADIINLPAGSNRDFQLLDAVSRSRAVDVELLVNESCLLSCPYALYHHTLSAHRSKHFSDGLDYCMLECVKDRVDDPSELLKAPWIRPEDLVYYEKTFRIDKFKIQGRQMPVEWIMAVVEAYSSRRYEGNLLDLISPTYPEWSTRSSAAKQLLQEFGMEDFGKPDVYIDNSRLDGFFRSIVRKGGCGPVLHCDTCGHCHRAAKKLVEIRDQERFEAYAAATRRLVEQTVASTQG